MLVSQSVSPFSPDQLRFSLGIWWKTCATLYCQASQWSHSEWSPPLSELPVLKGDCTIPIHPNHSLPIPVHSCDVAVLSSWVREQKAAPPVLASSGELSSHELRPSGRCGWTRESISRRRYGGLSGRSSSSAGSSPHGQNIRVELI